VTVNGHNDIQLDREHRRGRFAAMVHGLDVPLIVAPMTGVSSPELVLAATAANVAASFPTHNCRSSEELDRWLTNFNVDAAQANSPNGPVLPNLIVHTSNDRRTQDLEVIIGHRVPAVITSVGSPAAVVGPLHDAGILVLSDVASLRHVERAIDAGADGLILLAAGAGGQTGWANPLAFVRAARAMWDGPLILAGGVVDGAALLAARVAGCDLGYMGTRFIATHESAASPQYRQAVVDARLDDIEVTTAFTGLATSMIKAPETASVRAAGSYDARNLPDLDGAAANVSFFSAGHSVSATTAISAASTLIAQIRAEYADAVRTSRALLSLADDSAFR
jgi:nitronate monooxygenase